MCAKNLKSEHSFYIKLLLPWVDEQNISLLRNNARLLALMKSPTWQHLCEHQIVNWIFSANSSPWHKVVKGYDQLQGVPHTGERMVADNLPKHHYLGRHHQDPHSLESLAKTYLGYLSQMIWSIRRCSRSPNLHIYSKRHLRALKTWMNLISGGGNMGRHMSLTLVLLQHHQNCVTWRGWWKSYMVSGCVSRGK